MAVRNVTDGIGMEIVCDGVVVHRQNFSGPFLSPLNTNEIWVENLTTSDGTSVRYALLLPLEREVGVLEVGYNRDTEEWATGFWPMEMEGVDGYCQTLFIRRLRNALYSVCIFQTGLVSSSLRLYEITLNTSYLGASSVTFESFATLDGEKFTNVVYAQREPNDQYFFTITDGNVAFIDPSDHERDLYPLDYTECSNVTFTSIQYVSLLLVHLSCCTEDQTCSRQGIYYNTYRENPLQRDEGLPYHCPDFETKVVIHELTKKIHVRGMNSYMNYDLMGQGFQDGLCSGSSTNPWFAYQDSTGQIFVIDLSPLATHMPHMVSENGCLQGPSCRPITNISDILVIQEFDQDSQLILAKGIRPHENYSVVFEIYSRQPNIFALGNIPYKFTPTIAMPTSTVKAVQTPEIPTTPPKQQTNKESIAIGVVVTLVLASFVSTIAVAVVVIIKKMKKKDGQNGDVPVPTECQDGHPTVNDECIVAAQSEGNGPTDVVHGKNEVTDPTCIHKCTVSKTIDERQSTEQRKNDFLDKVNDITNHS